MGLSRQRRWQEGAAAMAVVGIVFLKEPATIVRPLGHRALTLRPFLASLLALRSNGSVMRRKIKALTQILIPFVVAFLVGRAG